MKERRQRPLAIRAPVDMDGRGGALAITAESSGIRAINGDGNQLALRADEGMLFAAGGLALRGAGWEREEQCAAKREEQA